MRLVGGQEVRCNNGDSEPGNDYTFLYGNTNVNHQSETSFLTCKGIRSAVTTVYKPVSIGVILLFSEDNFYEELECELDQFWMYQTKILFGHFNAEVEREVIFKLII